MRQNLNGQRRRCSFVNCRSKVIKARKALWRIGCAPQDVYTRTRRTFWDRSKATTADGFHHHSHGGRNQDVNCNSGYVRASFCALVSLSARRISYVALKRLCITLGVIPRSVIDHANCIFSIFIERNADHMSHVWAMDLRSNASDAPLYADESPARNNFLPNRRSTPQRSVWGMNSIISCYQHFMMRFP